MEERKISLKFEWGLGALKSWWTNIDTGERANCTVLGQLVVGWFYPLLWAEFHHSLLASVDFYPKTLTLGTSVCSFTVLLRSNSGDASEAETWIRDLRCVSENSVRVFYGKGLLGTCVFGGVGIIAKSKETWRHRESLRDRLIVSFSPCGPRGHFHPTPLKP